MLLGLKPLWLREGVLLYSIVVKYKFITGVLDQGSSPSGVRFNERYRWDHLAAPHLSLLLLAHRLSVLGQGYQVLWKGEVISKKNGVICQVRPRLVLDNSQSAQSERSRETTENDLAASGVGTCTDIYEQV